MIDYELESLFEQDSVNKQLVIELSGGTTLTNADIVSESLKLQESICSEQNLTFGSCEASVISFQTVCLEDLVGQTMNVSIILNGNTEKPFVLGEYKVASCKLSDDRKRRNVTAYDKIYDFINRDVIEWYNQLFPTAETTKTVKQVRDSFFNYFGIEQETTTLVNDSVVISKTISADTLSGKDVIKCILEINGCFGHIGRDGKFHYITISIDEMIYPDYDLFPDYDTFPSGQSMEFMQNTYKTIRFEEYNVKSIDCVAMREQSTGEPTIVGNPGNAYYIEDNFLLYGKDSTELTTIGENILPLMSGIAYTPLALTKRANPCYEVGDNIGVTLVGGQHLTTIVMKREISGIQAMFDVLGATGDEEQPQVQGKVQSEITKLKSRQTQIETSVDGITVDISAIEDEQSSMQTQINANAESISTEVTRATTAEGSLSSRITQTADSISAEVTRATGAEGTLSTRITATETGLSSKVSKDNIISEINQSAESVDINADRINLNGAVTANNYFKINTDGSMEAVNGKFSGNVTSSANGAIIKLENGNLVFNSNSAIVGHTEYAGDVANYHFLSFTTDITARTFRFNNYIRGDTIHIQSTDQGFVDWPISVDGDTQFTSKVQIQGLCPVRAYPVSGGGSTIDSLVPVFGSSTYIQCTIYNGSQYGAYGITFWASDRKLKKNIKDTFITNALGIVDKIKHRSFDWKDETQGSVKLGYIAQELEEVIPESVITIEQPTGDTLKQIDNSKLIPYLSKAIQELSEENKELKTTISDLAERISKLENKEDK